MVAERLLCFAIVFSPVPFHAHIRLSLTAEAALCYQTNDEREWLIGKQKRHFLVKGDVLPATVLSGLCLMPPTRKEAG